MLETITGTQIGFILVVVTILGLIFWNRAISKEIVLYNKEEEKKFQELSRNFVNIMRSKGHSEEEIQTILEKLRQKAIEKNKSPEEKDLNLLFNNPQGFLENKLK